MDDVVGVAEGHASAGGPGYGRSIFATDDLPDDSVRGCAARPVSANEWLRAVAPEPWTASPPGSSRLYLRFGDDGMTPVVTVRATPSRDCTVTVRANVFDRGWTKTRRPCGDDVSQERDATSLSTC